LRRNQFSRTNNARAKPHASRLLAGMRLLRRIEQANFLLAARR